MVTEDASTKTRRAATPVETLPLGELGATNSGSDYSWFHYSYVGCVGRAVVAFLPSTDFALFKEETKMVSTMQLGAIYAESCTAVLPRFKSNGNCHPARAPRRSGGNAFVPSTDLNKNVVEMALNFNINKISATRGWKALRGRTCGHFCNNHKKKGV